MQDRLQVSKILQQIRFGLNEGSGATENSPIDRAAEIEFTCDHPFLFVIDDEETRSILFAGIVQ